MEDAGKVSFVSFGGVWEGKRRVVAVRKGRGERCVYIIELY